jgi:hypothetical protein
MQIALYTLQHIKYIKKLSLVAKFLMTTACLEYVDFES